MNVLYKLLVLGFFLTQILFVNGSLEEEIESWVKNEDLLSKKRLGSAATAAAGTLYALQKDCTEIMQKAEENLKRARFRLENGLSEIEDAVDDENVEIEECVNRLRADLEEHISVKTVNACVFEAREKGSKLDRQVAEILVETRNILAASAEKVKACTSETCFEEQQLLGRQENEIAVSKALKFSEYAKDQTIEYGKNFHKCVASTDEKIEKHFFSIENEIKNCSKMIKKDEL